MPSKKLQYTQETLLNALAAINSGMSYYRASRVYNIPKTTLLYKKTGKTPLICKMGPTTILSEEEENLLIKWLFHISDYGFPATKEQLLDSVQLLMKNLKRDNPFVNDRPGRKWYESFQKRHPELAERVSQNLSNARAQVTETKIRQWFSEITVYFESKDYTCVTQNPKRVYNCDETAFFLSPKENKVLVHKGEKAVYNFINNDEKECLTTLIMCNAAGDLPPPMVVYTFKRLPQKIVNSVPKKWGVGRTENGWMTGETFFEYITNIFYPWLIDNKIELPIILYVDGHSSHLTMALSQFCAESKIILVALFPNSTHILQPLDVAFFRPLKVQWKKKVHKWRMENCGRKLTREDFAKILEGAIQSLENREQILINGFRTCGLYPFTPENINFYKIFKSSKPEVTFPSAFKDYSITKLQNFLKFFEDTLGEKTPLFRESGPTWNGDIEDTNLFKFWQQLQVKLKLREDDENDQDKANDTNNANLSQIDNAEVLVTTLDDVHIFDDPDVLNFSFEEFDNLNDLNYYETKETTEKDVTNNTTDAIVQVIEETIEKEISDDSLKNDVAPVDEIAIQQKTPVKNDRQFLKLIPSPFKKSLFWPSTTKEDNENKKRKPRDKVPAVASSEQWQKYYENKQKEKDKKEEEKNARKLARERKKEQAKTKTNVMEIRSSSSSDSEDEEEIANVTEITTNAYIVVRYDNSYFPGLVLDKRENVEEVEYQVKAMAKSGPNWKWPKPDDILWYKEEDIIQNVSSPKLINKRGTYVVKEMANFRC